MTNNESGGFTRRTMIGVGIAALTAGCAQMSADEEPQAVQQETTPRYTPPTDSPTPEPKPSADFSVLNMQPIGYTIRATVEIADANAISIEHEGEEVLVVNEDGTYPIASYDDGAIMDVSDVEFADGFTAYAIYGNSYMELESTAAA